MIHMNCYWISSSLNEGEEEVGFLFVFFLSAINLGLKFLSFNKRNLVIVYFFLMWCMNTCVCLCGGSP